MSGTGIRTHYLVIVNLFPWNSTEICCGISYRQGDEKDVRDRLVLTVGRGHREEGDDIATDSGNNAQRICDQSELKFGNLLEDVDRIIGILDTGTEHLKGQIPQSYKVVNSGQSVGKCKQRGGRRG